VVSRIISTDAIVGAIYLWYIDRRDDITVLVADSLQVLEKLPDTGSSYEAVGALLWYRSRKIFITRVRRDHKSSLRSWFAHSPVFSNKPT
jgi:hypothetical protein